jgi:hypothetical protein
LGIVWFSWVFYGAFRMLEQTSTLKLGDRAPGFELGAANRSERFTLDQALQRGPVVLEFLRGTW